jgi:hypothetical protein
MIQFEDKLQVNMKRDSTVKEGHIQLKQPPRPAGGKSIIEEKLEIFYKRKEKVKSLKSLKIILCGGKIFH